MKDEQSNGVWFLGERDLFGIMEFGAGKACCDVF